MSRRQCCLCDDAKLIVAVAAEQGLCTWETVDVDTDKALLVKYGNDVPVIMINGKKSFEHRVSAEDLRSALEGVLC
jgi:glutaredoxin